jgi:tRNA dimethylallyltransferase
MPLTGSCHQPLIAVLGPTAVGKTGIAIKVAQAIGGEIINADSRQVYRYMDIGTAKPTPEERAQVTHHLIDVVDPDESLTVAEFQESAYDIIDSLHAAGRVPMLVGGTGQYISAVTEGWSIPRIPPNPSLRAELEAFADERGVVALHERLAQADPEAASKIHPNNVRRVIRALEVCIEAGSQISVLQQKRSPPYIILELGLDMQRQSLYERADQRVDEMMECGFLDEVRHLLDLGYDRTLPSMSGLGYAQLAAHLQDGLPLDSAVTATKFATHDFIRRQYTWFRGHDNDIVWHNVEDISGQTLIELSVHWLDSR